MFENDDFKEFMDSQRESMEEFKKYVEKCDELRKEGTALLNAKLEDNLEFFEDLIMLISSTSAFEWDPELNTKFALDGRTVLVPIAVPQSLIIPMSVKKHIKRHQNIEVNEDVAIQKMCYMIMIRGITAVLKDSSELQPKMLAAVLGSLARKMTDD